MAHIYKHLPPTILSQQQSSDFGLKKPCPIAIYQEQRIVHTILWLIFVYHPYVDDESSATLGTDKIIASSHTHGLLSSSFIGAWKGERGGIVLLQQKAHRAIHLINHFLTKASTTPATHTYHLQLAHSYSYLRHILQHMLRIKQHDCNELWRCKIMLPLTSTLLAWFTPKNKFAQGRFILPLGSPCFMDHKFMKRF